MELTDEELDKVLQLVKEEAGVLYPTVTGMLLLGKDVLCAGIWQALGEAIDDEELEKLIQLMQRADESFIYYATHYIDKCNIELLKTVVEKRKDKLRNIAKRIVKKPQAYMNMEAELRYWEKEYKTTIYELHDPNVEYPDDFEW